MLEDFKDVLTTKELSMILPLGRSMIYKMLKDGTIKSIRVGTRIIVPKQSVIDFLTA